MNDDLLDEGPDEQEPRSSKKPPTPGPQPSQEWLFSAGVVPFKGMRSAVDPTCLGTGEWALAENIRPDNGTIQARFATTGPLGVGLPAGTFRGCSLLNIATTGGNVKVQFVAVAVASEVRIYSRAALGNNAFGLTFSEVTAASGQYGDTRFTETANGDYVRFASFVNPYDNRSYVLMQNGTDDPRLYGYSPWGEVRAHKSIAAPTWQLPMKVGYSFPGSVPINDPAKTTIGSSAHLVYTQPGGGVPNDYLNLAVNAAVVAAEVCTIQFPAGTFSSMADAGYLCFVTNESGATAAQLSFWDNIAIEFRTNFVTIAPPVWDASSSANYSPYISVATDQTELPNGRVVCFPVPAIASGTAALITKITFRWVGTAPTANYNFDIFAAYLSGKVPSGTSHVVSYYNSGTLAESAGAVMATVPTAPYVSGVGGPANKKIHIPITDGIYVNYSIPARNPETTDLANGVDTFRVYNKEPGSTTYFLSGEFPISQYSAGVWSYIYGSNNYDIHTFTSSTLADGKNVAPDAFTTSIPIGNAIMSANDRVMVAIGSNAYVSDLRQPLHFTSLTDLADANSGSKFSINGENVQAWAAATASALGSANVYLFTDKNTYALSTSTPTELTSPQFVAAVGCLAPFSVAAYKDAIFFVDNNYQIRRFSYGILRTYGYLASHAEQLMKPISRLRVDDKIKAVPTNRIANMWGIATYDRYYLAYTPSGGSTNTKILVWDETVGTWVQDAVTAGSEGMTVCNTETGSFMYFPKTIAAASIYTHEDTSSTSNVAVRLTSLAFNLKMWDSRAFLRTGVVIDKQTGQSITIVKTSMPDGDTDTSSIDLSTSVVNQAYRWDNRNGRMPGVAGVACQWDVTYNAKGGTNLYGLMFEHVEQTPGADV